MAWSSHESSEDSSENLVSTSGDLLHVGIETSSGTMAALIGADDEDLAGLSMVQVSHVRLQFSGHYGLSG